MWKTRRRTEAVSPVIATILMVAITVVLAAVLYVMVMGFGGPSTQTPTGSFVGTPTSGTYNTVSGYKLTFGVISPSTKFTDCKVVVTKAGTPSVATTISLPLGTGTGHNDISVPTTPASPVSLIWTDLAADNAISTGDYMTITGGVFATPLALPSSSYTVTILFTTTGGSICSQSWSF